MNHNSDSWKTLRWPILLLFLAAFYGTAGYMIIEGWRFIDALYMTAMTLSTVGYKEIAPMSDLGQFFTITLIASGVGIALVTLTLVARWIAEGDFGERSRRRRMQKRIDAMDDHYIICAYGRVGRTVAREFEAEGVPFVTIDKGEELEERMLRDGVAYVIGDPASEGVLIAAGIGRAKGLICAVDSDADNVYITLAARSLQPDLFIVARASEAISADRLYRAGANRVISPYVSSGRHMAMLSLRPQIVDYLEVGAREQTNLRLEELQVDAGSDLVGRALTDACGKTLPLALRRSDGEIIPNPDPVMRLQAGDMLVLLGQPEDLRPLEGETSRRAR
ncbi:MAG TPA: potassium channel protein [Actinomycetota bacterium]|jgi:voltage-gated potassium channel|nr:potassium channel protein [Actinomycetota bacterium]